MPRSKVDFDVVRNIALALADVEESTSARGPAYKVRGRLLTCVATHKSAEPNSLMVRIGFDERAHLLAAEPDTYYVPDHYLHHPAVLVRLSQISPDSLRNLLGIAWLFTGANTKKRET